MFTGTAQFNIPLYQLKSNKLSVPISLNYSTNGVKVDQIASWVGMGWSLNAGGVITRMVRDRADEISDRMSFEGIVDQLDIDPQLMERIIMDTDNEEIDTEPDLYSYNFNGQNGKFIIDTDGFPRLIPHQDITLEVIGSGALRTFEITTKGGVKYYFGEKEQGASTNTSVEKTRSQNSEAEGREGLTDYYTAWYLTRIVHPTGDVISFKYTHHTAQYDSGVFQSYNRGVQNPNCSDCSIGNYSTSTTEISVGMSYLTEINTNNILITFESSLRTGGIGFYAQYNLDAIKIIDKSNSIIGQIFNFNYDYSTNTVKRSLKSPLTTKRLFLSGLIETGTDITSPKEYSFSYNSINNLPSRLSFSQDHWGYYNGANNSDNFMPLPSYLSTYFWGFTGANREPNWNYSIYGSLNKISYPTGGTSEIDYEAQEYWDGSLSQHVETGGIRVKRITTKESDTSTPKIERYYYGNLNDLNKSSSTIPYTPNYHNVTSFEGGCNNPTITCTVHHLSSNSNNHLYNVGGSHIAYHSVVKSYGENFENGGEYFKYRATVDSPGVIHEGGEIVPGSSYTNTGWNSGTLLEKRTLRKNSLGGFITLKREDYLYSYETESDPNNEVRNSDLFKAGVIKRKHTPYNWGAGGTFIYCDQSNVNSKTWLWDWECTTNHKHWWASGFFWEGYKCARIDANNNKVYAYNPCYGEDPNAGIYKQNWAIMGDFEITLYDVISKWHYLKQKTITQYDEDGLNPITSTIDYEYDNVLHSQISKTITINSKGDSVVQKSFYPLDYDYTSISEFQPLVENYFKGVPIDIRQEINGKLTSGNLFKYNDDGQVIEFHQATSELGSNLAFSDTNPYSYGEEKFTIDYNVATGNIEEYYRENDVSTVLLWAYNNTYPVAKIQNTTLSEVITAMNSVSTTFIDDLGVELDKAIVGGRLEELRTTLTLDSNTSEAMVSTYVYDPLIGVVMQTAPNGLTTHYQYDDFNRLKAILNNDEDVIQYINYNYASDPELSLSIGSHTFDDNSGSKSVTVTSNRNWTVTESVSWLSITGGSGTNNGSFTINATTNTGAQRTATVAVTGDGLTQTVSVTQTQQVVNFTLSPITYYYLTSSYFNPTIGVWEEPHVDIYLATDSYSYYNTVQIQCPDNSSYFIDYDYNAWGWINPTYNSSTDVLSFTLSDPNNYTSNYASIRVNSGGVTKIISVMFDSN